jgi:PST family polysaccharide transporter
MLEGLTLLPIARMRRGVRFRELAVADTARVLCDAGTSLMCAINGIGYWSLVAGYLAGHACHAIFILYAAGMRPAWPTTRGLSAPLSNAKRLLVASITNFAAESADAWVGGAVVGAAALGGYTFMMSLARSPIEKIAGIIAFASGSLLGNLRANSARIGQAVLRLARVTSLLIFPVFAGIALVADDLVVGVLGPKWHPFVPSLRILCLFFAMQPLYSALDDAAIALGHSRASAINGVISLLILPVSFFVLGRHIGATGLALAWLIPRPLLIARLLLIFNRSTGLRLSPWIACFREPVLGVLLMAVAVSAAQRFPSMAALSHLPRLVFLSTLGATVYGVFLLTFARADVLWLRGQIKR